MPDLRLRSPREHKPLPRMRKDDQLEDGDPSMITRLSSIASRLSAACLIVTVALWLDSFNRYYGAVYLPDHPRSFELYVIRGALVGDVTDLLISDGLPPNATRLRCVIVDLHPADLGYYTDLGFAAGKFGELWFHLIHYSTPVSYNVPPVKQRIIVLPMWFAAFVFALLPARWLKRRHVVRRRRATARCVSCGYDLRASAGRCPECGTPIPVRRTSREIA